MQDSWFSIESCWTALQINNGDSSGVAERSEYNMFIKLCQYLSLVGKIMLSVIFRISITVRPFNLLAARVINVHTVIVFRSLQNKKDNHLWNYQLAGMASSKTSRHHENKTSVIKKRSSFTQIDHGACLVTTDICFQIMPWQNKRALVVMSHGAWIPEISTIMVQWFKSPEKIEKWKETIISEIHRYTPFPLNHDGMGGSCDGPGASEFRSSDSNVSWETYI